MGAIEFENVVWGDQDMRAAYDEVVARERAYHGSDPYSGSIANSCGVYKHYDVSGPIPLDEAQKIAQVDYDKGLEKGGAATAIPVLKVVETQFHKVAQTTVRVEMDPSNMDDDAIKAAILKELNKGKVAMVVDMPKGKPVPKRWMAKNIERFSEVHRSRETTTKTKTVTTKGKTETRHFIIRTANPVLPVWEDGFPSAAEARKKLPTELARTSFAAHLSGSDSNVHQEYEIVSMTRRVGGEALIKHEVVASKVSVAFNVSLVVQTAPRKVTDERGWLFYGLAAW